MASSQGKSVALKGAGAMVKPDRSRPASWDVKLLCMVQFLLSNGEGTEEEVSRENACSPCPKKDREKGIAAPRQRRSEEHTSELQSLMRISYAVFCLKKKNHHTTIQPIKEPTSDLTNDS